MAYDDLVDRVVTEMSDWYTSLAGEHYRAPRWWEQMMQCLIIIKEAKDVDKARRSFLRFSFLLIDIGVLTMDVVPSIRELQSKLADESGR